MQGFSIHVWNDFKEKLSLYYTDFSVTCFNPRTHAFLHDSAIVVNFLLIWKNSIPVI